MVRKVDEGEMTVTMTRYIQSRGKGRHRGSLSLPEPDDLATSVGITIEGFVTGARGSAHDGLTARPQI
jgi:hypothetical protein